jgi:hypothetical protein
LVKKTRRASAPSWRDADQPDLKTLRFAGICFVRSREKKNVRGGKEGRGFFFRSGRERAREVRNPGKQAPNFRFEKVCEPGGAFRTNGNR